jgi:hypothetical protein
MKGEASQVDSVQNRAQRRGLIQETPYTPIGNLTRVFEFDFEVIPVQSVYNSQYISAITVCMAVCCIFVFTLSVGWQMQFWKPDYMARHYRRLIVLALMQAMVIWCTSGWYGGHQSRLEFVLLADLPWYIAVPVIFETLFQISQKYASNTDSQNDEYLEDKF